MSDLADKHNYGIDTYLNNMLASRMEPLKNMPGYIDIQTYADLDKDVPENKAADLRIRIPLDMRAEATCRAQTVQSLRPDFHRWACFVIVCACQGLAVGAFRALTGG